LLCYFRVPGLGRNCWDSWDVFNLSLHPEVSCVCCCMFSLSLSSHRVFPLYVTLINQGKLEKISQSVFIHFSCVLFQSFL
jgi:hypothetical protein